MLKRIEGGQGQRDKPFIHSFTNSLIHSSSLLVERDTSLKKPENDLCPGSPHFSGLGGDRWGIHRISK